MAIKCAILAIGSELLEGSVIDMNSAFLGEVLNHVGVKPAIVEMIPDDKNAIVSAIKEAASMYQLVLMTGGLGPTFDDITCACIAEARGIELEFNEQSFSHIKARLEAIGVTLHAGHSHQAELPKNCHLFENRTGTACGIGVSFPNSYVIAMPGVPSEMKIMFNEQVLPFIKSHYSLEDVKYIDLHFGLLPESDINKVIGEVGIPEDVTCIINAGKSEIAVKIRSSNEAAANGFAEKLISAFPKNFMGRGVSCPAEALINALKIKHCTVATAESCTGGLIGKKITDIPGASAVYTGSVISYSNEVKMAFLGVKSETLAKYGAVSAETASEMAQGVVKAIKSNYGVSVTGIAGSTMENGSIDAAQDSASEKPVGTVYIGVSDGTSTITRKFFFSGTRDFIRERSANAALFLTLQFVKNII